MTPRILISCLLFTVSALGQGREMTLDDVLLRTRALTPRPLVGLAWKDAGHFTYLKWEGPRPTAWVSFLQELLELVSKNSSCLNFAEK